MLSPIDTQSNRYSVRPRNRAGRRNAPVREKVAMPARAVACAYACPRLPGPPVAALAESARRQRRSPMVRAALFDGLVPSGCAGSVAVFHVKRADAYHLPGISCRLAWNRRSKWQVDPPQRCRLVQRESGFRLWRLNFTPLGCCGYTSRGRSSVPQCKMKGASG
jgi:hypothetical protein